MAAQPPLSELNSVEAELREIEDEFAAGRMNAFGAASTHDAIARELRKLTDLELQVFFHASAMLREGMLDEHALQKSVLASVTAAPSAAATSTTASGDDAAGSASAAAAAGAAASAAGGANAGGGALAAALETTVDRTFNDVARHFRALETPFGAVGDSLRHMCRHVAALNDIAERINSASGTSSGAGGGLAMPGGGR